MFSRNLLTSINFFQFQLIYFVQKHKLVHIFEYFNEKYWNFTKSIMLNFLTLLGPENIGLREIPAASKLTSKMTFTTDMFKR